MDVESIKEIVLVACIPIGIYLYHRYMKIRGGGVTWDELVETFSDEEFWDHIISVKDHIEEE